MLLVIAVLAKIHQDKFFCISIFVIFYEKICIQVGYSDMSTPVARTVLQQCISAKLMVKPATMEESADYVQVNIYI